MTITSNMQSRGSISECEDDRIIIPFSSCLTESEVRCSSVTRRESEIPLKPKRPLSAYNIFFQSERAKLLQTIQERKGERAHGTNGRIGFASLARSIAHRWKCIDPAIKEDLEKIAANNRINYQKEMRVWKKIKDSATKKRSVKSIIPLNSKKRTNISLEGVCLSLPDRSVVQASEDPLFASFQMNGVPELAVKLDQECMEFMREFLR